MSNPQQGITVKNEISLPELAKILADSKFFKDSHSAAQAAVKVLAGQELGLSPIASMRGIHVFDGRIEISSATMLTLIKKSDKYRIKIIKCDKSGAQIEFHDAAGSLGPVVSFTLEDAKKAGLAGKKVWQSYPEDMCFARALSRGFRRYCPELAGGPIYIDGEVSDEPGNAKPTETEADFIVDNGAVEQGPQNGPGKPIEAEDVTIVQDEPEAPQEPNGGPYGRFMTKCGELKEDFVRFEKLSEYYQTFADSGVENRSKVAATDTDLMKKIIYALLDKLEGIRHEKADMADEILSTPTVSMEPTNEPETLREARDGGQEEIDFT